MSVWITGAVAAPKRGCEEATYEDAFRSGLQAIEDPSFRVGISDGATESAFARLWATALVNKFVDCAAWETHLDSLAREWAADVWSRDLPWNVQEKASGGAHASLLGAVVTRGETAPWQTERWHVNASIFGDTCYFIVNSDGQIERAEPYQRVKQFDLHPYLLSTAPEIRQRALYRKLHRHSTLWPGQHLILCTDAIGRWMLAAHSADVVDLISIARVSDRSAFDQWLEAQRTQRSLKDDDSTIAFISRA